MGKRILLATPRFAPEKPAFAPWGGNRYTQPEGGAFFPGRSRETSENRVPEPLLRRHSKHRPKGLSPSGRARLVTGLAAERGPFPPRTSSGAGMQGQRRCLQKWPLPSLPCPLPGPAPGLGRVHPGLRGYPSPRLETPTGSLRRSTPAERQASVAVAAVLTILSLGSAQSPQPPPPSSSDSSATRPLHSQPMRNEVDGRPPYGGPQRPFPAAKRSGSRRPSGSGGEE